MVGWLIKCDPVRGCSSQIAIGASPVSAANLLYPVTGSVIYITYKYILSIKIFKCLILGSKLIILTLISRNEYQYLTWMRATLLMLFIMYSLG